MKPARLAGAVAAVAVLALPIASAGATSTDSNPTVDLSTDQAVVSYLRSVGIDPSGVVIQRGTQNYAGPSCPGAGWNCTTATKVVQVAAADGSNVGECTGEEAPGSEPPQNCVIMQGESEGNTARCIEKSDSPAAVQSCDIIQISTTGPGSNQALAEQVVHNQMQGSTQSAQQHIHIQQTSGPGKNVAKWTQTIHFISQDHTGPTTDSQDGHSEALIEQNSDSGDSSSDGTQFQHFSADAHDGQIDQNQNTGTSPFADCHDDQSTLAATLLTMPNECAVVTQSSQSGNLSSNATQMEHLQANAKSGADITQTQGRTDGGQDLGVDQESLTGPAPSNHNVQHEHLQANGQTNTNLKQFQHGPQAGNGSPGPNQCCNLNASANFDQQSLLSANGTSQLTLDTLAIADATLLANDENALLSALTAPLAATVVPLEDGGDDLEQDSSGGIFYDTTGQATASQNYRTNNGHFQQTFKGNLVFAQTDCATPSEITFAASPQPNECVGTGFGESGGEDGG